MDNKESVKFPSRVAAYFAQAAVMVGALFVLSRALPVMPAWGIALAWVVLSALPAVGLSYHWVVKKTFNQGKFQSSGYGGRINRGRVVCLVVCFILAAFAMACLLVECPKWNAVMWVLVVLAVPGYFGVSYLVGKLVRKEYVSLFLDSRTALWSTVVLGVVLCIAYAVVLYLLPPVEYTRVADAFAAQPRPFDASPSTIMSEYGKIAAVVDGLKEYALSKTAEGSFAIYILWHFVLYAGTFFGVSGLLATCAINPHELKRVFAAIKPDGSFSADGSLLKGYVVFSAALPLLLAIGFVAADGKASEIAETKTYTMAEEFARGQVSLLARVIDGKMYDPKEVDNLLSRAKDKSAALEAEQREELKKLVNAAFDARIKNVDKYLDWYYRPFADWEVLFKEFTGSAEDFMNEQFVERISEGVDDSAIDSALSEYQEQAEALKAETLAELSEYEITGDYPDWLFIEVDEDQSFANQLNITFEPVDHVLTAKQRLGISAAVGTVGGIIAKRLVTKVAGKTVFKTIAKRTATLLGAAGGIPGLIATTVVADVLLQKGEEAVTREAYEQEIKSTLEEQRTEMLAAIE